MRACLRMKKIPAISTRVIIDALVETAAKFYRHLQKMPANFYYKTWKIHGPCMEHFVRLLGSFHYLSSN